MTHASTPRSAATPPKSLVWKDRPKSRKVSQIRTVPTIHRTTRLEPPTEDTTSDTAPQPNVGDAAGSTVSEEPAPSEPPSEPPTQVEAVQPPVQARKRTKLPWPHGSGLPGFGAYTGKKWYNSDTEEQDENDDPPRPCRSFQVLKYKDRHSQIESASDSSSQETSMMTSPPGKTESNQARARCVKIQRVPNYPSQSTTLTFAQTRAGKAPIPQTTNRCRTNATKGIRSSVLTTEDTMKVYVKYRIAGG
jgi:hypothetical protein